MAGEAPVPPGSLARAAGTALGGALLPAVVSVLSLAVGPSPAWAPVLSFAAALGLPGAVVVGGITALVAHARHQRAPARVALLAVVLALAQLGVALWFLASLGC